ncbi:MAG: putative peptidoglycan biosynthesis protein MurJ [Verrucomicrobia bacterium ADurb.Bin474]|nr:MAG: putative peptidoglycan biosynthesis protein MurJ [Verrucomicrobia bacterium ADurb.Bin474]
MFGLAVLAEPIISLLFVWGRFEADQVAQIGPLLAIHAIGIPFYSLIALTIRGFHASKDMKSPVRIAVYSLFFNTALSVALMYPFGVIGLASANTITSILQTLFLFGSFRKRHFSIPVGSILAQTARILAISALMGGACYILRLWWLPNPENASKVTLAVATSGIILSGVAIYAALVWASGLKTSILRWLKK